MDHDGSHAPPPLPGDVPPGAHEPAAWRVTFEYDGDQIRIVAQHQVAMVAPPDDAESLARGRAGYWVEVRDARGRPLYQQVITRPIQHDYEVFSPDPDEALRRVAATEPGGVFQAVVPDLANGHEIVLFGRMSAHELASRAPRQLVKARLRETPPPGGRVG